ncbi:MAG: TAXI family TRAP transporter solute-binding subunit [Mariprofundus sp.]|nr:TAXI family TRAP transporter solute-binding subunit [Mariprofundus sp.]
MRHDKLKIYIPALLLALLGFVIAFQFVDPAPPSSLIFSAGQPGGAYYANAERYRDYLKQRGIAVTILESAGSLDNIKRLKAGSADIAFVQSGIATGSDGLQSLGSMYYEPLWIFLGQNVQLKFLSELKGKRIAIGLPGSGTRALALQLLQQNGVDESNSTLLAMPATQAAKALIAEKVDNMPADHSQIDAIFMVSAASSKAVQMLQHADVPLMSNVRATAYTRTMPSLSSVLLPQGALNLTRNTPPANTALLASTATLMINKNLHPALQALLMQAAADIHAKASLFSDAATFPSKQHAGIALSKVAENYYKSGPPFLQRFLPFWAATLVDRLKVMLLPFIALLLPLIKVMPPLYRWRIRSRIYRWYDELHRIDAMLADSFDQSLLDDLNRIESEIRKVHVPLSYAKELYDLRLHVALIQDNGRAKSAQRKNVSVV